MSGYSRGELEHVIPLDAFIHEHSMDCDCRPQVKCLPAFRLVPHIVHTRIDAAQVPDHIPEEWEQTA